MPVEDEKKLIDEVLSLLRGYSGKKNIDLDQMLYRDIGIYGGDGVMIRDDLEAAYGVDFEPLIPAHTTYLPPNWWDRLRGRKCGPPVTDMTVRELVEYLAAERRKQEGRPG